jgi:hypothetical protein
MRGRTFGEWAAVEVRVGDPRPYALDRSEAYHLT